MNRLELSQPPPWVNTIARLAILLVSVICILATVGWIFDVPNLKSVRPGWTDMKVITLLCLGTCAASLTLTRRLPPTRRQRAAAMTLAIAVELVGLLTVLVYLVALGQGHESSPGLIPSLNVFLAPDGRMALWTAGVFVFLGCALVLLAAGGRRAAEAAHALTLPAALASYLIPVSYLLGVQSLHRLLNISVAMNTGVALCALCLVIFCSRPDTWLMRVFTEDRAGGAMARRLFPALLVLPVVIGWLRLYGERQGIFGSEEGVVLVALAYTVFLLWFLWLSARSVNRTDQRRLAVEIALRETEGRFATTLASIGDGVIATDLRGRITFMNGVAQTLTGWALPEASGRPVSEVFRVVDAETGLPEESPAEKSLRLEAVVGLSNHAALVRRDGTTVPIDDSGAPIRDRDGRVTGVVVVFRDITARMEAEKALRESEEHFRALTEALPQVVWTAGADGGVEWLNQHGYAYTGRGPEVGRDWTWPAVVHPEDLPGTQANWEQARQRGAVYENELRLRRADGEYRWFLSRAWPLRDSAGSVVRWVGTDTDIQDMKQAAMVLRRSRAELEALVQERTAILATVNRNLTRALDELRASQDAVAAEQQRFRDVLEMLPVYVALLAPDHHVPFANRFFRERFGDSGGRRCYEFLFGRTEPCEVCESFTVLKTGMPHAWDWTGPDGRNYEIADFPFTGSDGATQVMEVGIDVTERRAAEAELRAVNWKLEQRATQLRALTTELAQAEDRERRRLAQLLHDHLQQLLVATRFAADSLHRTARTESQRGNTTQMLELLDQAIGASRSLTMQLSPPVLHEAGLTAGLMWLARWMESKHDFRVAVEAVSPADELSEDLRLLFFQAVRELLFNAVKHSGVHEACVVLDTESPDEIRVTVSDEGSGFDAAAQEALGAPGTFGLFNIRERLAYFDGRLSIDSSPGRGTRVTLTAPVFRAVRPEPAPPAASAPQPAASETPAGADGNIRVLVADDHVVVRQGLVRMLGREPSLVVVGEAVDGYDAVEKARTLHPEVVLMDLSMPRMNGVEATKLITSEMPHVRVIGLSMHLGEDVARQMTEAGAVRYLSKDTPIEEITAAIREACRETAADSA